MQGPPSGGGCMGEAEEAPGRAVGGTWPPHPLSYRTAGEGGSPSPQLPRPAPLAWSDFVVVIPNFPLLGVRFPSRLGPLRN